MTLRFSVSSIDGAARCGKLETAHGVINTPVAFTDSGNIAFTVAAVPTGMKAGVFITP
jgi:queuine/archaeosine tRNA-ribosyltransferase